MKKPLIVYFGPFFDSRLAESRGLKTINPAGSNRISRLSDALNAGGYRVYLVSPGTSLRAACQNKHLIMAAEFRRTPGRLVLFPRSVNLRLLNVLASGFIQLSIARRILKSQTPDAVIIYNFNIGLALLAFYLRLFTRTPIVHNVEDISFPNVRDFLPRSRAQPLQQSVFCFAMHVIASLSDSFLLPTKRFSTFLPKKKPRIYVTGCLPNSASLEGGFESGKPAILFSGKLDADNGIEDFISVFSSTKMNNFLDRIKVDICGSGPLSDWTADAVRRLGVAEIRFHGFTNTETYQALLKQADICVALQDPNGRHSAFKTPSKFYEYLGYGKAVIATDVGDLVELDGTAAKILKSLDKHEIAAALIHLIENPEIIADMKRFAKHISDTQFRTEVVGLRLRKFLSSQRR
jgi:glycosyltransferase involved in cell wall biosynthesis